MVPKGKKVKFKKYKITSTAKLKNEMDEEIYTYKRYGIPFCLALFESDMKDSLYRKIIEKIRKTDKAVDIDRKTVAVFYRFTKPETGVKAAENLLYKLEKETGSKISCGLVFFENGENNLLAKAFYALEKAKKGNFSKTEDNYLII